MENPGKKFSSMLNSRSTCNSYHRSRKAYAFHALRGPWEVHVLPQTGCWEAEFGRP